MSALHTKGTYLKYKTSGGSPDYTKLCDIVNYPDMGSTPNKIDSTTLSELVMKTSILGLQESPDLEFEAMYNPTDYRAVKALKGQKLDLKLAFGDGDEDGAFTWSGQVDVYATGGGVDEVRKMMVIASAETEIEFTEGA